MKVYVQFLLSCTLLFLVIAPNVGAQTFSARTAPAHRFIEPLTAAQPTAEYRPAETIVLQADGNAWVNDYRTRNVYENGHRTFHYTDRWTGSEWADSLLTIYTIGPGGLLTLATDYAEGPEDWVSLERTHFTYTNGLLSQTLTQVMENGEYVDSERTNYTLSNGFIVAMETELWDGDAWMPSDRITFVQDGDDLVQTSEAYLEGDWHNGERFIYTDMTLAGLQDYITGLQNALFTYEGLLLGFRLPDGISQSWTGEEWLDETRQSTEVTLTGTGAPQREEVLIEGWEDEWVPMLRTIIEYSGIEGFEGKPAVTTVQFFGSLDGESDPEWTDFYIETYQIEPNIRQIVLATLQANFGFGMQNLQQVRINWTDVTSTPIEPGQSPDRFALDQNYPNPFNPTTRVTFRLQEAQHVRLAVYDLLGREVALLADGLLSAGEHTVRWEATGLPSGTYLYRLDAGAASATRRMTLLK